jgi:tetratricopeptide (TPR) repeat protein
LVSARSSYSRAKTAALASVVHGASAGNPFFVGEILDHLDEGGRPAWEQVAQVGHLNSLAVPAGVSEVVDRRLDRLDSTVRAVLTIASVVGAEFDAAVVVQASEREEDQVLSALDEAISTRFIHDAGPPTGRLRFAHDIIRQSLYQRVSRLRRVRLHHNVGDALERLDGDGGTHDFDALAHHFLVAARGGGGSAAGKAIDYAEQAARHALSVAAYENAASYLGAAIDVLDSMEADAEVGTRRHNLLLDRGHALWRARDVSEARATFHDAANVARDASDGAGLANVALAYGNAINEDPIPGAEGAGLINLLREALAAIGPSDSVVRVELLALLALELSRSPQPDLLAEVVEEAVAMAGRLGAPASQVTALTVRAWVRVGPDVAMKERLASHKDLIERAQKVADRTAVWQNRLMYMTALVEAGQIGAADAVAEDVARMAEEMRIRGPVPWITAYRGMREWLSGRFDAADRLTNQALQEALNISVDPRSPTVTIGAQLMAQRAFRDGLDGFIPVARQMVEALPHAPAISAFLSFSYCEVGELNKAKAEFDYVSEKDFEDVPRDANWLMTMWPLSLACATVGDRRRARILFALLRPMADRWFISLGACCLGPVTTALGILATTLGRFDQAERYFKRALADTTAVDARTLVIHAQREYGIMLLARMKGDDGQRARRLLSQTLASADELGMASLAAKIRADLVRA